MKIKHQEILISNDHPFANCKLSREPYAKVLTEIVNSYADGFVLAINNEWGTGKTTFVKMWEQQLKNEGFQTIYFNSWENDFDNNPLVALMSELKTLSNAHNEEVFKSVVKKGAVLLKNIAPALVKSLFKKYFGDIDETLTDVIENATKASAEIFEEQIKEYALKKKTISEFKEDLAKFVRKEDNSKPLIFIIDELDRCRPNYSVEVLEQIKHFFSVSGIVFVLSIDKNHLASAVKGFYGSEQIESHEYLRRFIDLEYSIPKPSTKDFTNYLFLYFGFNDFFSEPSRRNNRNLNIESTRFILITELLLSKNNVSLRVQEKIFAHTRLTLCSFQKDTYIFPELLFFLVYLKLVNKDYYSKIENNELSFAELSKIYGDIMVSENVHIERSHLVSIEAQLIWFYNNNREGNRINLNEKDDNGNLKFSVKSKFASLDLSFAQFFENMLLQRHERLPLNYLINKINLTESVNLE